MVFLKCRVECDAPFFKCSNKTERLICLCFSSLQCVECHGFLARDLGSLHSKEGKPSGRIVCDINGNKSKYSLRHDLFFFYFLLHYVSWPIALGNFLDQFRSTD